MPKLVDHEHRRTEIAAAAARLIAERGIDAVTMVAIGEAAGVTTGAVTHYFSSKDEIILAALRWADDAMQTRTERASQKSGDVLSVILEALPTDKASRIEWLVWGVFCDRATRSKALMAEQRSRNEEWLAFAEGILRRMKEDGELDPSLDLALEAKLAVAFIDGLGLHAASDPKSWPDLEQRRVVAHYLERLEPQKEGR